METKDTSTFGPEEIRNELRTVHQRIDGVDLHLADLNTRFTEHVDATSARFDAVDQRFDAVDQRFDAVHWRIDGVENRLTKRINTVETTLGKRIDDVEERLNKRIDGVEDRFGKQLAETEIRLATAINDLAGTLHDVHRLVQDRFGRRKLPD